MSDDQSELVQELHRRLAHSYAEMHEVDKSRLPHGLYVLTEDVTGYANIFNQAHEWIKKVYIND